LDGRACADSNVYRTLTEVLFLPLPPGILPAQRDVWMCDFDGFVVPEMVKERRVIIISPRHHGAGVALVVPVSTTGPRAIRPVHIRLPGGATYECFSGASEVWVKADLVAHVRFERLSRVRINYREIRTVRIRPEHFERVQCGVLRALGLGRLAAYL
jgi:uncharacterized protein YifN (PemK superfamily)